MKIMPLALVIALLSVVGVAGADEGMWLFNRPPREMLQEKYGFTLTDAWLTKVRQASVRFNNGGSGGFVSPDGLVVTNHHIGADAILKLSHAGKDLHRDGFYATTQAEEMPCPDLELNVLAAIVDVTDAVRGAVKPEMTAEAAAAARRAVVAKIARESQAETGLRSDVVTLYRGAEYHLYRYKKYTDVRLVMAPEHMVAFFGGDAENFEYPRYDLDICFFRVYENGKPAPTPHYFRWSTKGARDRDLVFVTGHPGTTNRLETLAHLKHRRDVTLPYSLQMLRHREAILTQYATNGPEAKRLAKKDLFRVANARKAYTGMYHGLLDPAILAGKAKREDQIRSAAQQASAPDADDARRPWDRIATALAQLAAFEKRYDLIEKGDAFNSEYFRIARHLVRLADERPKPDGERLPEYRTSAQASLEFQLFSPAPIHADIEQVKLAASLAFLAENVGGDDALLVKILAGRSPGQCANALIAGTKLADVAERKRLHSGGAPAVTSTADTLIRLAILVDGEARGLRRRHILIDEELQQAYADVAKWTLAQSGKNAPPDATFTLRLAFGTVQGYRDEGGDLPPTTAFAGLFARAAEQGNEEPFRLPQRWLDARRMLDLATPLNFVSTADTIGGNSGSPVLNRAGELVGINFDRNRHGLVRNFVYTDAQARHIAVHSGGVLEALRNVYHADALIKELTDAR